MITQDKIVIKDRKDQFRKFALRRTNHEVLVSPITLPKEERRLHLRQTLLEDHQFRILNNPEGSQTKFNKLYKSPFSFFRGTALIFYRDYAGMDNEYPVVFTNGDIHPENFGVMPDAMGEPFFGVNDFDEAAFAPFTYDIKRGATGFYMAAKEVGIKKKDRKKIVEKFAKGYIKGLKKFAKNDEEKWHQYKMHNSPGIIKNLLKRANRDRQSFLSDMIDLKNEKFKKSKKIIPISKDSEKFQQVINDYVNHNNVNVGKVNEFFFKVKDVAIKKGSGTASLGLNRYFVLINGPGDQPEDNVILELKQARRSALYNMIPEKYREDGKHSAEHIVKAHNIHLAAGDPFYGKASLDDKDYIVRERSPFKEEINVKDLDEKDFKSYASICGVVLSQTHARSDKDTGISEENNIEKEILSSINPDVFIKDTVRFGKVAAKRIYKDHNLFKKDMKIGVYKTIV